MRYQPATDGVDDGGTHLSKENGLWWLYKHDGDLSDTHAVRQSMQCGIGSDTVVDVREFR